MLFSFLKNEKTAKNTKLLIVMKNPILKNQWLPTQKMIFAQGDVNSDFRIKSKRISDF